MAADCIAKPMKLFPRILFVLFLVACGGGGAHAAASDALSALIEQREEDYLRRHPSAAITRGDRRYLDRFETNLTDEYLVEERRLHSEYAERLGAIDRDALSEDEQLSYDILRWELETQAGYLARSLPEILQLIPVNQMWGPPLDFAREMQWSSIYPFNTAEDYEKAIARMEGFARWIDQAIVKMREGMARDVTLPRVIVERVIAQVAPLSDPDIEASEFMGPITNMPDSITGRDRERLRAAYRDAVAQTVIPAYDRLRRFLSGEYLEQARMTVGLSAMPQGREIYLQNIILFTTTAMTPEEIHAIGLAEIARIEADMERVREAAGFIGTLDEFKTFLRNDEMFEFADGEAMLEEFARIKNTVESALPGLFDDIPEAELEFRFVPDYAAASSPAAFYSQPARDGARPGLIYLNAYDLPSRPVYTADALFLHEGLPGHHLQVSLAIENEAIPEFRRYGGYTAFAEGWGLYAETLGAELGLYADPYRAFGGLSFEAWRAARLVIDTGIHWFGWTRDEAIAYLLEHTALTETDAVAEVERYIAIPGQALAYKIGQRKFLELRRRAQEALGAAFDIRDFHDAVLGAGAMPLPLLEARIERWITQETPR